MKSRAPGNFESDSEFLGGWHLGSFRTDLTVKTQPKQMRIQQRIADHLLPVVSRSLSGVLRKISSQALA
jgi:hypothetical protein